LKNELNRK